MFMCVVDAYIFMLECTFLHVYVYSICDKGEDLTRTR